ncbi:MAG TPA: Na/Pi symporter [Roseiflexaceae bacterium]|nr:Na/Pi symporter [Roseiflexaceae bacterium]
MKLPVGRQLYRSIWLRIAFITLVGLSWLAFGSAFASAQEAGQGESTGPDWWELGLGVLAGLGLFLYGVTRLAQALDQVAGERMKELLNRSTQNRFAAVGTGFAATTILDSSSVTIVSVIAMVSAGLMTFAHSLGVVMGSNIGTTMSSVLFATHLDRFAAVIFIIGLLLHYAVKDERWRKAGLVILGLGLIFLGLNLIGDALEPLEEFQPFLDWMGRVGESPLLGVLIGAGATVILQSSSATLGIIIAMASEGLIGLPAGVAMMLGAEIGTTADTLIATIGRSRPAVRTGMFHLLFNLTTVVLGVVFVQQLTGLAQTIVRSENVEGQITAAQVIFNVTGVLLLLPFTRTIARGLERLIPDEGDTKQASQDLGLDAVQQGSKGS